MTGCPSCRHQCLLSDSNPGPSGYKPSVLTTEPRLLPLVLPKKSNSMALASITAMYYSTRNAFNSNSDCREKEIALIFLCQLLIALYSAHNIIALQVTILS